MSIEAFARKNSGQTNYDLMKQRSAALIASRDLAAAALRRGLDCDGVSVSLRLLDLPCRLRIADGYAECADGADGVYREADFNTAMILYDLLGYASPDARPTGDYARLEQFSAVQNAHSYAGEGAFSQIERRLDRDFAQLPAAFAALGGVPHGKGDLSYRLPLYRDLCIELSFWRSDEEFPASLDVRFDCAALQYLHYETMWYAAFFCLRRLQAHLPEACP